MDNNYIFLAATSLTQIYFIYRKYRKRNNIGLNESYSPAAGSDEESALAIKTAENARKEGNVAKIIRLIHFNDVYNIEEGNREPVGGAARFVGLLNKLRSTGLPPLVFFIRSFAEVSLRC